MRRIRLRVAYDGTAYCGWQVQPEVPTIEGELNQAISRLTKEEIIVIGASRTDAGVHAKGNVAVFDTESTIPADRFAYALNPLLPEDIVVVASDEVEADWHPRYCDTEKTYEYKILNSKFPDPMRRRDTYHVSFDLDLEKMREAAEYLKGEHDFKSFCNVHTQVEDTVRTIYDLEVEKEGELITIRVRGNGFLYNMVRILAGTLIGVGRGAIAPEQIPAILEAKDRQAAGNIEFLLDKNNPGIVPAAGFYQFFQMGGRGFFSSFFNADLLQSIVPGKITECRMIDEESGVGIL